MNFLQTSFIENLIRHRKFTKVPRKIYYIYPKELEIPPVKVSDFSIVDQPIWFYIKWDQLFPHIDVEFVADLPTYAQFWAEIKRDSLVVIDDLWSSASNNEHVSNCFKVYSKKYKFSIAIVTQVSLRLHVTFSMSHSLFIFNFRISSNRANSPKISDRTVKLSVYLKITVIIWQINRRLRNLDLVRSTMKLQILPTIGNMAIFW